MPAVATDWQIDAASDIKRFKEKPYMLVARIRMSSGASVYPSGGVGIVPPPAARLGLRKGVQFINVLSPASTVSGGANSFIWGWDNALRTLRAYGMHATTSIVPATLVEAASGTELAGMVLYIEAHGL